MEQRVASNSQTAIVTGGSRGLGRGIVAALATRNMRVIALAKDAGRLAATAKELGVESAVADVADPNTSARLLQDLTPDLCRALRRSVAYFAADSTAKLGDIFSQLGG